MARKTVFISYSHKDEDWKDLLRPHLGLLEQIGLIELWDDRQIDLGEAWFPKIRSAMDKAAASVCLISADYLASSFCTKEEIPYLLQRQAQDGMVLIVVLCRQCAWKSVPWLRSIQMLPRDGKSVASDYRDDPDKVFSEVAEQIAGYLHSSEFSPARTVPLVNWPAPEQVHLTWLSITYNEAFGRQQEMSLLDDMWQANHVRVVTLVAWRGTGKSKLVRHWLKKMADENYRGANRVYTWSFQDKGAVDQLYTINEFMNSMLAWSGDPNPSQGSPWERANRLMRLMRHQRVLLILDGLEPLQSGLTPGGGAIGEPALAMFLRQFVSMGQGLCVITTRFPIADLDGDTDRIRQIKLGNVSASSGRALMRIHNIQGTDIQLESAVSEVGCEALAVDLLIAYISGTPGKDIAFIRDVPDADTVEDEGRHARRVMTAIVHRLGNGPEIQLMNTICLWDRPVHPSDLACLTVDPVIPGLTDQLVKLNEMDLANVVKSLRELKLLAPESMISPEHLETHPVVREHFATRLRKFNLPAWLAGNLRLYQHLRDSTETFPETLSDLLPLYHAVAHGCRAGLAEQALNEVYLSRIIRGDKFFGNARLGAVGHNLYAMRAFFSDPWVQTDKGLSEVSRATIIRETGANLLSAGQLLEAAELFQASYELCELAEDWTNGARQLGYLAELHLKLGRIDRALTTVLRCIRLAERSGSGFRRMRALTLMANIYLHMGNLADAGRYFEEAAIVQCETEPDHPFFISSWGYWYFDYLLHQGRIANAAEQATKLYGWNTESGSSLLAQALREIALGRLGSIQEDVRSNEPSVRLESAVDLLKKAAHYDVVPVALIALADRYRLMKSFDMALLAIDEAEAIAVRGKMRLFEADCLIIRSRVDLQRGLAAEASRSLRAACSICITTGYGRGKKQIDELSCDIGISE